MLGTIAKHRSVIITLVVVILGLVLIGVSQTFEFEWAKVQLDRLVAEAGALLLVVGILHWFFELGLRREMLREVAATVAGSNLLHVNGLETCNMNSRQVDDRVHWSRSATLTIGRQYSTRFFKDFHDVLTERCTQGRPTNVTVLRAEGTAARYLQESQSVNPMVKECTQEISNLLGQIDSGKKKHVRLLFHDSVLRYSFVMTDEYVWITFFTNSSGRTMVPAFKVRAGTPLFKFFQEDIKRLLDQSHEVE
jgi:hypothetical protein